uniref:Fork-head domain-containing protein n=1 Tax=Varanus komodoensis TaxID=61221 RepID=A0A8D2IT51_VARKO
MDLRLQKPAFWASLHLRSGLRDWDMARELGLGTTCDQLPQGQARGGGGATGDPWEGGATHLDAAVLEQVEGSQGPTLAPRKAKAFRFRSRKLKRTQGGWPRPPLNYCTLISLALSSSTDSSLTVQEIYQFTRYRQHFPFFRTAPEGWKNTIRHNLCFSSRFEKTTHFVCLEGNRKSRLWKLTPEGRHKLREEVLLRERSRSCDSSLRGARLSGPSNTFSSSQTEKGSSEAAGGDGEILQGRPGPKLLPEVTSCLLL